MSKFSKSYVIPYTTMQEDALYQYIRSIDAGSSVIIYYQEDNDLIRDCERSYQGDSDFIEPNLTKIPYKNYEHLNEIVQFNTSMAGAANILYCHNVVIITYIDMDCYSYFEDVFQTLYGKFNLHLCCNIYDKSHTVPNMNISDIPGSYLIASLSEFVTLK